MGLSICFAICGGGRGVIGIGSVVKNGFGILKFAEAPNLFRPRGVYIGGRGGW